MKCSRAITLMCASMMISEAAVHAQVPARVLASYPIEHWGEFITIPTVWAGKPACFIVDSGACCNVVDSATFRGLTASGEFQMRTDGGAADVKTFLPPTLRVGPFKIDHCGPVIAVDLSEFDAIGGKPIVGVLGVASFNDLVLQLDFDRGRLFFLTPRRGNVDNVVKVSLKRSV